MNVILYMYFLVSIHLTYFTNLIYSEKSLNNFSTFQSKKLSSYSNENENQFCSLHGNRTGMCRPLHYCFLSNLWENVYQFTSTFCTTKNLFIPGMCCPIEINKSANIIEDPDLFIKEDNENNEMQNFMRMTQFQGCGISSIYKPKIMGGRPADPKEWPWMVALLRNRVSNFCGGVLITRRHIISAAHCTNGFKPQEITARLGEYDFKQTDDSESRDFRIVDVREHQEYNKDTYENDISILKTHRLANYNDYIRPICLPSILDNFENKTATVTGWGTQGFGAAPSDILMEVDILVWEHEKCVSAYPERVIKDTLMCAGVFEGRKDSCQGDSGGPLMHKLSNGRWIAVGIVSWGLYCGLPGRPGLYTQINQYIPWIVENTLERL